MSIPSNVEYMERLFKESGGTDKSTHPSSLANNQSAIYSDNFGHPVGNFANALNIAGYSLASDPWLMEKQQTFNRAKIVERMVHPSGAGAFGYFEVTNAELPKYCKAKFLSEAGKKTPIFVRFSTVTVGKEFPDSCRNPRGFAIKFYTEEGNYDLVGLNFPVFFVRDPALGPEFIRSQQRNPSNFLIDYNSWFDFLSLVPESSLAATMLFSDYGTPDGFRKMNGFGCHTFKWVNSHDNAFYVRYTFLSENGLNNLTWDQAVKMCGEDPDYSKRDLFEHLEKGGTASWKASVQIIPVENAQNFQFDLFDVTKDWPTDIPSVELGRLVLNRNPENYHRDVEQAAFSPGSLVPGIEPSPDLLLQFRTFFYRDAQLHRIGTNLHQIPVNCPFRSKFLCPFARDGAMRVDANGSNSTGIPHYFPNSLELAKPGVKLYDWQPAQVTGAAARVPASKNVFDLDSELVQARDFYHKVLNDGERQRLHLNVAVALKWCRTDVQLRFCVLLHKISPEYARGVVQQLNVDVGVTSLNELDKSIEEGKKLPITLAFDDVEKISKQLTSISNPLNGYQLTEAALKLIPPPTLKPEGTFLSA